VNGAGKTTQLQILMGNMDPDAGEVIKSRRNLNIAYLNQEFDINPDRTVREELASAYEEGMAVLQRTEEIQKELEDCTDDMDRMSELLDELDKLSNKAVDLDMNTVDKKIDKMMPELGFSPDDNDRYGPCHHIQPYASGIMNQSMDLFVSHILDDAVALPHCGGCESAKLLACIAVGAVHQQETCTLASQTALRSYSDLCFRSMFPSLLPMLQSGQ